MAGQCTLKESGADGGECIAGTDEDCAQSVLCSHDGMCTAEAYVCVATSVDACEAATSCSAFGLCVLGDKVCVATDGTCHESEVCGSLGRCSLNETYGVCAVTSDDDCAESAVCADEGLCTAATNCPDGDTSCEVWGQCVSGL